MSVDGAYDLIVLLLGGLLAGAAGFCIFNIGRKRLLYDLHKIPGPAGWPLLGNALDVIGSKILHHHQVGGKSSVTSAPRLHYSGYPFTQEPCGNTLLVVASSAALQHFLPRTQLRFYANAFCPETAFLSWAAQFVGCLL